MFKYVKLEFSRRYDDYLMSKNTKCKISSVLYKSTKLSTCLKYFKYLANCVVSTEEFLRNTIQSFTSYNDKNTLIKKQNTFEGTFQNRAVLKSPSTFLCVMNNLAAVSAENAENFNSHFHGDNNHLQFY